MRSLESFAAWVHWPQHLSIVNLRLFPCETLVQDDMWCGQSHFLSTGDIIAAILLWWYYRSLNCSQINKKQRQECLTSDNNNLWHLGILYIDLPGSLIPVRVKSCLRRVTVVALVITRGRARIGWAPSDDSVSEAGSWVVRSWWG